MPIPGVEQPDYIDVDDRIRLRKFDNKYDFAFEWYQDRETVYLVDGVAMEDDNVPYTMNQLRRMYEYLDSNGELYFIEILDESKYKPIGDVTFWKEDMPIVIGDKEYRGKGIGVKIIKALIQRGKQLGYKELYVNEIYEYNLGSRRCFEKAGFHQYRQSAKGWKYRLIVKEACT